MAKNIVETAELQIPDTATTDGAMVEIDGETVDGLTRRLANFVLSFRLGSAPQEVLHNAKTAILDCIGVSVLAASEEIGSALLTFAREEGADGPCTFWGTPITANARDAALFNGTLAHGLDFDDRNHSSTYSLAAPLALAEQHDLSGAQVLEAFIVAREVRNSLDAMFAKRGSGIGPGAKGWHSNGILGPMASAAASARVLDLNAGQTLAAIGLAAGSCGALTRDGGTMAKPFRCGHAAATGVTCALLAKSGLSADDTVLEARYGLLEALGPLPESIIDALATDLGTVFNLSTPIRAKKFASCSGSHSGIEAMLRLLDGPPDRRVIAPDGVAEIACDLKPYPLVRQSPRRGFEGRFSLPFCLAMVLVNGDIQPHDFTDANVEDPIIQGLMKRTRHTPGSDLLTVTLSDGTRVEEPLAPPTNIMGWEEVAEKFHQCVEGILSESDAAAAVDMIANLETLSSVRDLTTVLRTETT
jgi:2-methylcitrate dehydratase PrpD